MAYPSTIDSFSTKNTGDVIQASHVNDLQTAVVAVETKVGVTGSAVTSTLDYQVNNTASVNPGHKHTFSSLSDFTVSSPVSGDILQYNGTKFVNTPAGSLALKFGGTGADGALNISSGVTTLDCGNASVLIKNYSSISITGTGSLAFSNPHANGTTLILKSQGAVTLTSSQAPMIDASGMGAAGGAGSTSGSTADGNNGSAGVSVGFVQSNFGFAGTIGSGVGAGGAISSLVYQSVNIKEYSGKYSYVFVGAGGGSGGVNNGTSSAGGRGGGALLIECGGALNFTTASGISVAGKTATAGSGNRGGSGGGSGGFCGIFYNTLTANTGTITVSGGGTNTGSGANLGAGGGGSTTAGGIGVTVTGGAGGTGLSLVAANTEYA